MKCLKNNKGMTLVEMIIGILLLATAGVMLAQSFGSAMNIFTRATLYQHASAVSSSTIELQEEQESKDSNVDIALTRSDSSIVIKGTRSNGSSINTTISGEIIVGNDNGQSELTYREFLPGTFDFDVPAVEN